MPIEFLSQVRCVVKEPCLTANTYDRFQVERKLLCITIGRCPPGLHLDERVQTRYIFQFGICVEKERCVIRIGQTQVMKFLQVCDQVVYSLSIEELEDYSAYT